MSEGQPYFSVITVVLNDIQGLRRTRDSVLSQSWTDFEWIIIDGGSVDGTTDLIRQTNESRVVIRSGPDRGLYDAMNKGTQIARGGYVNYLNAGDVYYERDSLSLVRSLLLKSSGPDVAYCGTHYQFRDGALRYRAPREQNRAVKYGMPAIHQATFFRRSFLDNSPYDLRFPISADYHLACRLAANGARAVLLNRPVVVFEMGGTSSRNRRAIVRESAQIQKEVLNLPWLYRFIGALRRTLVHLILDFMQAARTVRSAAKAHCEADQPEG
jgi:putative colanic acid biosynthesis glycosyltransferase